MKKFVVDPAFFALFPQASIGILSLRGVKEDIELSPTQKEEIKEILNLANKEAKKYLVSETISQNPVVALWRDAYKKFPTKKGARCSIENLLKRVLHGNEVGSITPSVDLTNAISLSYGLPIGAEDLDKFVGDLHLGLLKGGEDFLAIGEEDNKDKPLPGELAYYDEKGVVCRCFNWRDGQRTAISDNTSSEFIAIECLDSTRLSELKEALDSLEAFMKRYLKAETITKEIVDKNKPSITIVQQ